MTDKIKPALTAEEWRAALRDRAGMAAAIQKAWGNETVRENDHALAALALIYQPFGFTREDVEMCRSEAEAAQYEAMKLERLAQESPGFDSSGDRAQERAWRSLASRIAALLPPEDNGSRD